MEHIEGDTKTFTANGTTFEVVYVASGSFAMGDETGLLPNYCSPVRQVTLGGYWIGRIPVTQSLYVAVTGTNPSRYKGDDLPVEMVCWEDAQNFLQKLSAFTGVSFSLPTEAQWEYAARGGAKSQHFLYPGSNDVYEAAWWLGTSNYKTHKIGQKKPNELGLYDMAGNVWEWCRDWYGEIKVSDTDNPQGPETGNLRVIRGGAFSTPSYHCQSAYRNNYNPAYRYDSVGFRLCMKG